MKYIILGGINYMNSKSNKILLGIIVLLLGIVYVFHMFFDFELAPAFCIVMGFAFLLLYITKRRKWSLVPSIYLIYWGIANVLKEFNINFGNVVSAMFFIVPGIIFLILFFEKKRYFFIMPSSFLIWLGIFIMLLGIWNYEIFRLLFACMGFAFLCAYILGIKIYSNFKLYIGVFCIAIAFWGILKFIFPFLFISAGLFFIISYVRNKNNRQQ